MIEQPANDPLGFELLFEPLSASVVPAKFAFLPLVRFGFEALLSDADLLLANCQDSGLLVPFGAKLILLTAGVILELQTFELNFLTLDFKFVAHPAEVLGDRRAARFDAATDQFWIDRRQQFRPRLLHRQPSFQCQTVRAFHFAAHHLEALSSSFQLFEFQRPLLGLMFDGSELGRALPFELCTVASKPGSFQRDFVRAIGQQTLQRFGLASQ